MPWHSTVAGPCGSRGVSRVQITEVNINAVVRIGTAGWAVPARLQRVVGGEGSHLERYSQRLRAVEINSSFHRHHRRQTYERWASAVPPDFRFSVKVSRFGSK
jgi:uncharacterized protein YecE (DUF72 family)